MTSPMLVTGGTGTLGRVVVRRLLDAGIEVRVLSRRRHEDRDGIRFMTGDLAKDQGIEAAVDGVGTILHCASDKKGDADAARNLVRAASRAGAPHLVYISIVGVDLISLGYFKSKFEAEQVVADSGLPWTTLRVTQFHDMVLSGAKRVERLPVVPVPAGFHVQPIDTGDVADRLVDLALAEPAGRVPDMAGPHLTDAADMIRVYLRARNRRGRVLSVRMPATRAIRAGALLVADQPDLPGRIVGRRSWEQFLADRLG